MAAVSPTGVVDAIYVAPEHGGDPERVATASAIAGHGIEGDRHFGNDDSCDVTLIEAEAIAAATEDYGVELAGGAHRRNVITEDVPLNHLVNAEFTVGEAVLSGRNLCEPCAHMAKLIDQREAVAALTHRGGLEADVVRSGTIRPGDRIEW